MKALDNVLKRLKALLPLQWFGEDSPNLDVALAGPGNGITSVYELLRDVDKQIRISTATGGVLDLIAGDFFGNGLLRLAEESDDAYRARIMGTLFREQGTKKAMEAAIGSYTGMCPNIVEAGGTVDPRGFIPTRGANMGTNYGDTVKPYHAFITVYRITGYQYANISGYGDPAAGYGVGQGSYIDHVGQVDEALLDLINMVKPYGTRIWVKTITGPLQYLLDTGAVQWDPPK